MQTKQETKEEIARRKREEYLAARELEQQELSRKLRKLKGVPRHLLEARALDLKLSRKHRKRVKSLSNAALRRLLAR
jgi:hypothetical protein